MRRLVTGFAFCLVATVLLLAADQVTVVRDVNLRPTASTSEPPIRLLKPPEVLTLVEPTPTGGFYHVKTSQGEDGWVWADFVSVTTTASAPTPPASAGTNSLPVPTGVFNNCDLTGTAKPQAVKDLNVLKNRSVVPIAIDAAATASAFMVPGDDTTRFSVDTSAIVVLYVTNVKVGGVETVNCGATDPQYRDTHIEGNDVGPAYQGLPMIVEVTPRWRAAESAVNVDWSTQGLHATLIGHWVEFTGWLLFDREHTSASMNTNPSKAGQNCGQNPCLWRETAWELHPVTSVRIVGGPSSRFVR